MNKLLVFSLLLTLLTIKLQAQQKPQYTQYTLNNYLLNPAIAGIEDYADLKLGSRHQWSGLEGAPVSYYATFHTPLMKDVIPSTRTTMSSGSGTKKQNAYRRIKPHHGLGGMVMTTKTGPLERKSLNASYAYHQPLTGSVRLAAGISPGLIQYSLNQAYITVIHNNDPALTDGRVNEIKFDLNMGLWLYSESFYLGVSGSQLAPDKRNPTDAASFTDETGALQKHYFITGGLRVDATPELSFIPSVMVKAAQPSPVAVDANVKAMYANRIWAGVSYRHKDAVAAMAGINVSPLLDVSYSYDASASPLGIAHSGSHEVVVGLKLRNTRRVLCPQFAW